MSKEFKSILCDDFKSDFAKNPTKKNLELAKEWEQYMKEFASNFLALAQDILNGHHKYSTKLTELNNELEHIAKYNQHFKELKIPYNVDSDGDLRRHFNKIAHALKDYDSELKKELDKQENYEKKILEAHSEQFKIR